MREDLDLLENAGPGAHEAPPVLVLLPDPEIRVDADEPILGRAPSERVVQAALDAGFAAVLMGPGTRGDPPGATHAATGDPIEMPALVVYEAAVVHPQLLTLMVAHPLESDERFTLYDDAGRPTAAFTGHQRSMPAAMPVAEELPWPEPMGPRDVVRIVYPEDRSTAEELVLRGERAFDAGRSSWHRWASLPTLRRLAATGRPVAQLELLTLAAAFVVLPASLLGGHVGLVLAALVMLATVHVSTLLPVLRRLQTPGLEISASRERLTEATRPIVHAAAMVGLTYGLVAQTDRSGLAGVVLLAAGGAAALLSLFQARLLLRGKPADVFALPDPRALTQRLDVRLPRALDGAPLLELAVLAVALPGWPGLPWSVLAASAVARLWRWFAGPSGPLVEPEQAPD